MNYLRRAIFLFIIFGAAVCGLAQQRVAGPDLSVAGVKLGDRISGKAFLGKFQPRTSEGGTPSYYFYNKNANTVMKITAASFDDPYFVTGIEVFWVDKTYTNRHFYLDKIENFETESGVFIGSRQSGRGIAATLIIGSPMPLGVNHVSPKDILRRKGVPTSQSRNGKKETLDYHIESIDVNTQDALKFGYAAQYQFERGWLQRFSIKLLPK
jgi:hypothetical protein